MSDITLSRGIRSNLLSLQNTADLIGRTQGRLSTGKRVNSALDNPTNFFTASSLNARANDLSNLLDGLSNGIKTLEAADNGLKSVTRTVESLQSTLRQARQDKSFKATSFSYNATSAGTLSFSGGNVGATPVSITAPSSTATRQSTVTASADFDTAALAASTATLTFTNAGVTKFDEAGDKLEFTLNYNGQTKAITIDKALVVANATDENIDNAAEFKAVLNAALVAGGVPATGELKFETSVSGNDVSIKIINANTTSTVSVTGFTATLGSTNATNNTGLANKAQVDGSAAVTRAITISDGTRSANVVLNTVNATNVAAARTVIGDALNSAGITATVGGTGNRVDLSGSTAGSNSLTVSGTGVDAVFGANRTVVTGLNGTAEAALNDVINLINTNTNLTDKVRASNDGGKLRIENLSTVDLSVTGASTTAGVTGTSAATSTIGGNEVRRNLVNQFNELRTQLDKLAEDAGFNGINLLRGDKLKLTFNETGTSSIEIQAKDAVGAVRAISTTTLSIGVAINNDFSSDSAIDARIETLNNALTTLRSQSSAFGSNLSVVQNRTDFTKATINTLKGGADNLTLADQNEEAANLLALQTRQQLASTALSLANQADQGVLRLF